MDEVQSTSKPECGSDCGWTHMEKNNWKPENIRGLPTEEFFHSGHGACAGCGPAAIMRIITKAAGPETIIVNATGCMEVVSSKYPTTAWSIPWVHGAFENAAPIASGIHASLVMQGIRDRHNILVIAGDGSSYDIGFGALSAALERRDKFTYVCYNNEAYANTGSQRSSATPFHAWTTTTPIGKIIKGKEEEKKPLTEIIAAHNIDYVATASLAYPLDLYTKVKKSFTFDGPSFINILSPCVLNWKYSPEMSVELARLAVDTGMWLVYEIENGKFKINIQPKGIPVKEYLTKQGRFKHLTDADISEIQTHLDNQNKDLIKHFECQNQ